MPLLTTGAGAYPAVGGGPAYQGPGDIVSGAIAWASPARAYSAAFASGGTAIMDLVDQAGANPVTINVLTTGFVNVAAITAWVTANSVSTIKVTKLYDQSGTGNHFTQAVLANMPPLLLSSLNGLPSLQCVSPFILSTGALTQAQPFSASTVYIRTSGTAAGSAVGAGGGTVITMGSDNIADKARVGFGTNVPVIPATDNVWHSFQGVGNGASGAYNVDGTDTPSQNLGTGAFAGNAFRICSDSTQYLVGKVMEGGLWPSALTPTQRGNISTNQHSAASGYNF